MIKRTIFLLLLAALPAAHAAGPTVLRFCSLDIDFAPVARVDGTGHYQYLLQQAAHKTGIRIERRIAPRRRCLDEIRSGASDGMIGAFMPERTATAVFPMVAGGPDVTGPAVGVRVAGPRATGVAGGGLDAAAVAEPPTHSRRT